MFQQLGHLQECPSKLLKRIKVYSYITDLIKGLKPELYISIKTLKYTIVIYDLITDIRIDSFSVEFLSFSCLYSEGVKSFSVIIIWHLKIYYTDTRTKTNISQMFLDRPLSLRFLCDCN
jgi:hypothetical protein